MATASQHVQPQPSDPRENLRQALAQLRMDDPGFASDFEDEDIDKLLRAGYRRVENLRDARLESLLATELPVARIDSLLAAQKLLKEPTLSTNAFEELKEGIRGVQSQLQSQLGPVAKIARAAFLNQFRPVESKASSYSKYRPNAVAAYPDLQSGGPQGYLRCMITGMWFPEKRIKAGHVYRQLWAPNVLVNLSPSATLLMKHVR
jgi:hypothetical protein